MQSPQYPDLLWMPPRSFTPGRQAGKPIHITVHETDNPTSSARGEASYMGTRTDGTSAHYIVDEVELIQGVRTTDTAHTALYHGNRDGIHYEFCGVSGRADTFDAQLRLAAKQMARDVRRHNIPVRRLTPAQTRAGVPGFNSHGDVTLAWPEDSGTHSDPGANFPWSTLFSYVNAELEGDDMATPQEVADAVWAKFFARPDAFDDGLGHGAYESAIAAVNAAKRASRLLATVDAIAVQLGVVAADVDTLEESEAALLAAVRAIPAGGPGADPDVIVDLLLAKLPPAVLDAFAARLTA